jgi:hypothetical protein
MQNFFVVFLLILLLASKIWNNLWLETDFAFIVLAFKLPWCLSNWWFNCICLTRSMNFIVFHIFRERNSYTDGLANVGLSLDLLTLWNDVS